MRQPSEQCRAQRRRAIVFRLVAGVVVLVVGAACGPTLGRADVPVSHATSKSAATFATPATPSTSRATSLTATSTMSAAAIISSPLPTAPATPPTTVSSPTAIRDQAQTGVPCRSAALRFGVGRISEPTGQHSLSLRLTNQGPTSCLLVGYPTVHLLDVTGYALPFDYHQRGDQVVTSRPPTEVRLSLGGTAYVTINKYRCYLGDHEIASRIQLLLPGDPTPLQATIPSLVPSVRYCGPTDPGSAVFISPFEATYRATISP